MYLNKKHIIILVLLALLSGLAVLSYLNKDKIFYRKASFIELKGWKQQDFVALKYSFMGNCKQGARFYKNKELNAKFGSSAQWAEFCSGLKELPNKTDDIRQYFERLTLLEVFQPFKSKSLFTGYYSPMLHGSYTKTEEYSYPLRKRPVDLVELNLRDFIDDKDYKYKKIFGAVENNRLKPYYTRKQIDDEGVLDDENVIVWVNDKIAAFFLHIQGSGEVKIDETGNIIKVGYAAQNGHAYYAIGRYMVKQGMLKKEEVSLQSIRQYLEENPDKVDKILHENPSYIFFAERANGPFGAFGNVLTANHSVATDRSFVPLGTPLFIETKVTATDEDFNNMVFAQDVGGAIKGAIRADIFFGSDEQAEHYSGKQNQEGNMYVFSAKNL
ncbi:MAG TPA: murein transglycosylase [Alphaproteobacteria bacterium]|nr:murein transglycosylase [Alphaproteobacteria bacterium]